MDPSWWTCASILVARLGVPAQRDAGREPRVPSRAGVPLAPGIPVMEANTFATTIYAQTPPARAFDYLRRLQNLDAWTLGSRMRTRIDDDTFMGTASGYQAMLCYHVRTLEHPRLGAIEWQCGYRYREYFKQYPVFVFPSRYADERGDEDGSYIHWV